MVAAQLRTNILFSKKQIEYTLGKVSVIWNLTTALSAHHPQQATPPKSSQISTKWGPSIQLKPIEPFLIETTTDCLVRCLLYLVNSLEISYPEI